MLHNYESTCFLGELIDVGRAIHNQNPCEYLGAKNYNSRVFVNQKIQQPLLSLADESQVLNHLPY